MTWLKTQFWKIAILIIKRDWGANCPKKDTDDFPDGPKELNNCTRCGSCVAKEVIEWIEKNYKK